MDYKDTSNIRLMRVYCSTERGLPLDQWTLVSEMPVEPEMLDEVNITAAFSDEAPKVVHYYYATFIYADGHEGTPSAIQSAMPGVATGDHAPKQNSQLN